MNIEISEPEMVLMTLVGYRNERMIACEGARDGKQDWEYCSDCKIKSCCWLRLHYVFVGGEL